MDFNEYDEAEVNGTLLFLIRIMRAMGIAPVLIQKHLSIYYIRVSSLFTSKFVGPSIVAVLCTLVGVGLVWDIYIKDSEGALRVSTPSYTALCILDLGFTITVSCLGAFGALKRMQRVICYLNHIKKINIEISEDNKIKQKYTIIKNILVVFNLTVLFCGSLIIMLLYSAVYPGYFIICTLAMLLFLIVRLVNSALHAVNCDLNDIITDLDQENFEFSRENESNDISNKISLKSINKVIDHLGVLEEVRPVSNLSMENEIKLHRLLSQYIRISDTVAMINESEGTLMLIILMSLTFYFVNSSYELVATIMLSAELVNNWKYFLICHFTWVTYTFFNIISIIEACYGTTSEMEQTRAIVGNLLCHATSHNDPLFKELENSFYQLYLFNLQYSPMGMLTMDRGLIIAIMGFAATYVLLLTDFGFKMRFTFG